MADGITRRDFLAGTQVALGASLLGPWAEAFGSAAAGGYYPPALTGLRGSHVGSFETMHARVTGKQWPVGVPDERYDLVVVGAGISGLAAAYFYRQQRPDARILILDNHDDFGGHAKRNEFSIGGDTRISYGGTESIDTPSSYSDVARKLLNDIGIDLNAFYKAYDQELYSSLNLSKGIVFDKATFGKQKLAVGYGKLPWAEFAARTPLNAQAKKDLVRVQTSRKDYLPNMSAAKKNARLKSISYETFLRDYAKLDPQLIEMYRRWGTSFWCVGIDEIPALDVLAYDGGMPGLDHTVERASSRGDEPYIFHFPDGNASVARLLVRALLPAALPGTTMEDVVTARLDYAQLDRSRADTRVRLNSTVVNTQHTAGDSGVDIVYVRDGKAHTVRAGRCIMACYNAAIPYLCPDLPDKQKSALTKAVKAPLVYTKVLLPNWRAFAELGMDFAYFTNGFFKQAELDYPVSLGAYRFSSSPDEPMVVHMCHVPFFTDIQGPEQWRAGRRQMLATPFKEFEQHVREQLDQALGSAGFDAGRDIRAITVNRWPHGYAYNPKLIWEPKYKREKDKPWVAGRQPFGRIAIANSDAGAAANTHEAIDQAWRAVGETLA